MSRNANAVIKDLEDHQLDHILKNVYIDGNMVNAQRGRYIKAVKEFVKIFGNKEIWTLETHESYMDNKKSV